MGDRALIDAFFFFFNSIFNQPLILFWFKNIIHFYSTTLLIISLIKKIYQNICFQNWDLVVYNYYMTDVIFLIVKLTNSSSQIICNEITLRLLFSIIIIEKKKVNLHLFQFLLRKVNYKNTKIRIWVFCFISPHLTQYPFLVKFFFSF